MVELEVPFIETSKRAIVSAHFEALLEQLRQSRPTAPPDHREASVTYAQALRKEAPFRRKGALQPTLRTPKPFSLGGRIGRRAALLRCVS